ncbi:MAG: methenyltetrahydrofolate cyclohydrolase [Desulfobacteraceae bacterium IS3]|nr:MAG: methenyltetrahydrofolate cyclohydrolase [Desulfobacteraceae bacterium IS3]
MFQELSIKEFLKRTASDSTVPGGGSVAALSAALAAALTEMAANLTIGKKKYKAVEDEMKALAKEASRYREKLLWDADRDSEAYNQVMAGYSLPKNTDEEKNIRNEAVQKGLKAAASVPLDVAKDAFRIMELAEKAARDGNKNTVTDAAVALMTARSAALSALYNVRTNLKQITDNRFVEEIAAQISGLEDSIERKEKEILSAIEL